ncbi:MAG: MFS transporter [Gemmatimonadetes bacterium]|nr:MFS transporter [Gemmatimonadota bacterium]
MSTAWPVALGRGRAGVRPAPLELYVVAALAYAAFGAIFQALPPFFEDLGRELSVGRTLTGLSMAAFLAPVAFASLLLGQGVDRYGTGRVGRLGFVLLLGGGALTALAGSIGFLLTARAVAGLGGGMVLLATLKLLAIRLPAARLGRAFGVFVAGLPVGTGIAFDLLNRLPSWRASAVVATTLVVPAGLAFTRLGSAEAEAAPRRSPRADVAALLARPALRQLTVLVLLGYAAIIAFTTWAPTRLVAHGGLAIETAALIASVLLIIDIPFAPLWGRVSDRVGRRKPFIVASFLVYGVGAFFVPAAARAGAVPLLLVVGAMGIGCAMFFPATLAVPQAIVPEPLLGAAYGLILTAQALGMALGPLALGAVFDHGAVPLGFFVIGGMAGAGLVLALRLNAR